MTKRKVEALACAALYGNAHKRFGGRMPGTVGGGSAHRMVDELKTAGLVDRGNEITRRGLETLLERLREVPPPHRTATETAARQQLAGMADEPAPSMTGKRADLIIIDDPQETSTEEERQAASSRFRAALGDRFYREPLAKLRFEIWSRKRFLRSPEWRWRLVVVANAKILASGQGYERLVDCEHAVSLVRESPLASIKYLDPPRG
jgi:uncharacterized protein YegP (UPF0339 family)